MTPRRVLITGANGFLGAALAKACCARGDEVRTLVRAGSDAQSLAHVAAQQMTGDVTDPSSLRSALEGVHTVFHLAGIRRASTRDEFMRVNAQGTRHVAEAMVQAASTRLVLVGSLAATGPSVGGVPRVESDSWNPQEWYGESKVEAERIAFEYRDRLEVTSCRPARIIGPYDRENLTFFKLVKRGMILRIGGHERRLSFVDVDDTVDQLLLQAQHPAAVGEAFFNASDETHTVEALMTMVAQAMGVSASIVPVPELLLEFLGNAADAVTNVTGRKLPLNRKLARQLLAPGWTCRIDKAKERLGYRPKRSIADSLDRSAKSYLERGWL